MDEIFQEYGQAVLSAIIGIVFLGILFFLFATLNGRTLEAVMQAVLG